MYHVIEVSPVDETTLESALNEGHAEGFELDRIEFIQQQGVRRPVIAYIIMVGASGDVEENGGADSVLVSDPVLD